MERIAAAGLETPRGLHRAVHQPGACADARADSRPDPPADSRANAESDAHCDSNSHADTPARSAGLDFAAQGLLADRSYSLESGGISGRARGQGCWLAQDA